MEKKLLPKLIFALLTLLIVASERSALALPIFGSQVYYEGGKFDLTVLQNSAGFSSDIFLVSKLTGAPVTLANTSEVGKVVSLSDLSSLGYQDGDALGIGIYVRNTGDRFLMGSSSSNPDLVVHAYFDYLDDGHGGDYALIGFEDLWGGGDKDYNDAVFTIAGVGLALRIPEPAMWLLALLSSAAFLWAQKRFRSK